MLTNFQQEANRSPAAAAGLFIRGAGLKQTRKARWRERGTCRAEGQRSRKLFAKRKQVPRTKSGKWTVPTVHGRVIPRGGSSRAGPLNVVALCRPVSCYRAFFQAAGLSSSHSIPGIPFLTIPVKMSLSVGKCLEDKTAMDGAHLPQKVQTLHLAETKRCLLATPSHLCMGEQWPAALAGLSVRDYVLSRNQP